MGQLNSSVSMKRKQKLHFHNNKIQLNSWTFFTKRLQYNLHEGDLSNAVHAFMVLENKFNHHNIQDYHSSIPRKRNKYGCNIICNIYIFMRIRQTSSVRFNLTSTSKNDSAPAPPQVIWFLMNAANP